MIKFLLGALVVTVITVYLLTVIPFGVAYSYAFEESRGRVFSTQDSVKKWGAGAILEAREASGRASAFIPGSALDEVSSTFQEAWKKAKRDVRNFDF